MSNAVNMTDLLREAVTMLLAQHIRARLMQCGCRLLRGSPEGQAKWIVSKWSEANVHAFYILVKSDDRFWSHAQLAREAGCAPESTREFWRKTIKGSHVAAHFIDTTQRENVRLFRRGREMFWGGAGIKLQVNTEMLPFAIARAVTDSTMSQTIAHRQNFEGACEAQESDESKGAEERTAARAKLEGDMVQAPSEQAQKKLFG